MEDTPESGHHRHSSKKNSRGSAEKSVSGKNEPAIFSTQDVILNVLCDSVALIILFVLSVCLNSFIVPKTKRGYFCSDAQIKLPEKGSSIDFASMTGAGVVLNLLTIILTEFLNFYLEKQPKSHWQFRNRELPKYLVDIFIYTKAFIFGLIVRDVFLSITKKPIGRLVPHFMESCHPQPKNGTKCSQSKNYFDYIEEFTCQNDEDAVQVEKLRYSFPSSHAAMASFLASFFIYYLQYRLHFGTFSVVRNALQLVVLILGLYAVASRVMENMEHWEDVTVALLIGHFAALWSILIVQSF